MDWTPLSESMPWMNKGKMPPKAGRVLVTIEHANRKRTVETVWYKGDSYGPGEMTFSRPKACGHIIAWAPLPEPYTGPLVEKCTVRTNKPSMPICLGDLIHES